MTAPDGMFEINISPASARIIEAHRDAAIWAKFLYRILAPEGGHVPERKFWLRGEHLQDLEDALFADDEPMIGLAPGSSLRAELGRFLEWRILPCL